MTRLKAFLGLGVAGVCVIGLMAFMVLAVLISLPDAGKIKQCLTTEMHKVYLCETGPNFVPYDQISPYVIAAVIMSEDASFFSHQGLDYEEIKESIIKDLNEYRFARGASTITQQLAKNVFLKSEKSIIRKLSEMYLALQIEKIHSKKKILALYLNVVEFGPGIYGIKAGARHYFDRSPAELTPEQAAFLAFLLPNPKKYRQSFDKKKLTPFANKMIRAILRKMLISKRITQEEYDGAVNRVSLFPWDGSVTASDPLAPYLGPPAGEEGEVPEADLAEPPSEEENFDEDEFEFDFVPEESPR